jgi:uncharacterized small protein (DUF1192 family)
MVRLGDILLEADVLTKRQLNKALAMQETGDNRKLGEILVELGYLTIDDMAEVMMNNGPKSRWKEEEAAEEKVMKKELSENTKFTLSIRTLISAAVGIATLVGFYYMMIGEIQEAKELPKIDNIYEEEYPSRLTGYNWPSSMEQYKTQVGGLEVAVSDLEEQIEKLEEEIVELKIEVAKKRDRK